MLATQIFKRKCKTSQQKPSQHKSVRWLSKRCQLRTLVLSFGCQLESLGTSQQPKRRSKGCPFFNFCPPQPEPQDVLQTSETYIFRKKLQHAQNNVEYVFTLCVLLYYTWPLPNSNTDPLCCQASLLTTRLIDIVHKEQLIYLHYIHQTSNFFPKLR